MSDQERSDDFEQLVDLISGTEDIKEFLDGLTNFSADMMRRATGVDIECAVTLRRRKRTATIGGTSERAIILDRIEQRLGKGPCVDALESGEPKVLEDAHKDPRWPEYAQELRILVDEYGQRRRQREAAEASLADAKVARVNAAERCEGRQARSVELVDKLAELRGAPAGG